MTIYALENELNDKLMSLGFLCYNKHVDSSVIISGVDDLLEKIKNDYYYYAMLRNDGADVGIINEQEKELDTGLVELGCVCFSTYVDGKMGDMAFVPLCEDISYISSQIANARLEQPEEIPEEMSNYEGQPIVFDSFSQIDDDSIEYRGLDINCPYGMEPIPHNFIQCSCGYRNREDAVFCAKCGTKFR